MHKLPLLAVLAVCAAVPAGAQVSVDLHALESLPATHAPAPRPAPSAPRPKVTLAPSPAAPTPAAPTAAPPAQPGPAVATASPTAPTPTTPATPAPPAPAPAASTDLPPAVPASAPPPAPANTTQPAGEAPKPGPKLRLPFAADQADLSKDGSAAIEALLQTAYAAGTPSFTVIAYAAGSSDDPSSARRLSLARAIAARNALMSGGVPSRRITVRALGSQAGDGPPDRVDISAVASAEP